LERIKTSERASVKLNKETHQKLCDYADKRKSKSLSKAIGYLLKQSEEIERLKEELSKTKLQPITSDVPLGMPQNPEKQKALEQLKQETHEVEELPLPQCNFAGKGYIDEKTHVQFIYCDDPKRKLKKSDKPMCVALTVCQACWGRKEWGREKREREQEDNAVRQDNERIWREAHPEPEPKPKHKTTMEKIRDGTLEYKCELKRETFQMKDLPCLIDHSFNCPNKQCDNKIGRMIEIGDVD
jgi:hypothetical protein